jgi:hypothetical protein
MKETCVLILLMFQNKVNTVIEVTSVLDLPTQEHHYTESLTCSILYTNHLIDFFIYCDLQ